MGKARNKRLKNQREFLIRIAQSDSQRFCYQWRKRLKSWSTRARVIARFESDEQSRTDIQVNQSIVSLVNHAWDLLKHCGDEAFKLMDVETRDFEHYCTSLISAALAPELYQPTFRYENNRSRPDRKPRSEIKEKVRIIKYSTKKNHNLESI